MTHSFPTLRSSDLIRRTSKFFLEAIGVAVAVSAVLFAVLAWRLSTGPVSLPILSQILEDAISGELEGGTISIGDTILRWRSEEHTSELQSLMRISYAVFCLKKKNDKQHTCD